MLYFKDTEFTDIEKLKEELKCKLDEYRGYLMYPVTITSDYSLTGHSENSEHGTGEAVDCKSKAPLWWQLLCAERAGFHNIGVYPAFNGIHLGVRPGDTKRRWIGLGVDNTQEYVSYMESTVKKYLLGGVV